MKSYFAYILAAASAVLIGLGGGAASQEKVVGDTIVLGAVLSFSGKYATNGTNTYNGYEFAKNIINNNGGISVSGKKYALEIQYIDDQSDTAEAGRQAERMIVQGGVRFMLGPYSSELTKAVVQETEYYGVPIVTAEAAARDLYNRGYKYLFGLLSTCEHYMNEFIDLAVQALESGRASSELTLAVAVQNERFSRCVRAAVLQRAGKFQIRMALDERLPRDITDSDMREFLEKVAVEAPDLLIISGHSIGARIAVRQMGEIELRLPYVSITHCESAQVARRYPDAAEGIYCPAQWAPQLAYRDELFGTAADFAAAIKAEHPDQYGAGVPYQAASAAAAVLVWKDAFERADDPEFEKETLREALLETDMETFYGRVKFAPTGQIVSKPMVLRQIRDGEYRIVPK